MLVTSAVLRSTRLSGLHAHYLMTVLSLHEPYVPLVTEIIFPSWVHVTL